MTHYPLLFTNLIVSRQANGTRSYALQHESDWKLLLKTLAGSSRRNALSSRALNQLIYPKTCPACTVKI